ncbi:MFS transporter [Kitasatospora sp. NPDC054939]
MRSDSLWRLKDFRTLFGAAALVQLGTNTAYLAVPLVAVAALDAGPGQVGALATLSTLAFLLIGLPAGAWVDRMRHRRVLITADLAKAALYASIPIAWWLDALTLGQLYAVTLLSGCATVFFDVATQSVLPRVVGPAHLVQANAAVVGLMAVGNIAGRGLGGALVHLLTAPVAVAATALSHLGSALRLLALRHTPAPPAPEGAVPRLTTRIAEGLRHVLGNPELRALALTAALTNLGYQIVNTLLPVLFIRELQLSAGALGLFWAIGGLGVLLGSRCAGPAAARFGHGRLLGLAGLCAAPAGLLVPLIGGGPWLYLAGLGWLLTSFKTGMDNVIGVSLRQRMTPDALLGRMNATFRFLLTGAMAIGAALAGLLGELVGLHPALWLGGVLLAAASLPVQFSPLRRRRNLPEPVQDAPAGSGRSEAVPSDADSSEAVPAAHGESPARR